MKLEKKRSSFTIVVLLIGALLVVLSGCTTAPPTGDQLKMVNDLNGTMWEGNLYENGSWHVFGDESGKTNGSATLIFSGNKVRVIRNNRLNYSWSATEKPVGRGYEYETAYTVKENNLIIPSDDAGFHELTFSVSGDNMEGQSNRYGGNSLIWKLRQVNKKEVAATAEKPVREEPKQEPPTSVSLPTSSGGMGLGFR